MRKLGFSMVVSAVVLAVGAPEAGAQNLFDLLFGGGNRLNRSERQTRERQPPPPAPKKAPKISSPSYYNYKPEPLARIDVAKLAAGNDSVTFDAALTDPAFHDALAEIGGIDLYADKKVADAIIAHYTAHPEFIWVSNYRPNERAERALRALGEAGSYGLVEVDYNVPAATKGFADEQAASRLRKLMHLELALSARVLRYASDAHSGRVDPNGLSGYHDFPEKSLDLAKVLETLSRTRDVGGHLQSYHPRNEEYQALRVELEAARASAEEEIVVDPDTFVRPGGTHAELPDLLRVIERDADAEFRAEHGELLAEYAGSETYARELVPVVKAAQRMHDLAADGIVGPRTVGALAGDSKAARIEKVLLAMERLRWLPSDLGDPRVVINAASFTATYTENGTDRLSMRAVVGKRSNQTSFFHDEIEYVEFNPYWGVPQSIIVNEMLPKLWKDPSYLDRRNYEVSTLQGRQVSSASIDWTRYGADIPFDVRQRPGPNNALGELKIMFPNSHAIYMHDTPQRHLFERDTRAYSHGCVRLQRPREMAAAVLDWSVDRVGARVGEGHSQQETPRKIPVYVGYFTAWADDTGAVSYHGDVYDRDDRLRTALDKVEDTRAPSS